MDCRRLLGRNQRRTVTRKRERGGTPPASRGAHGRPWPVNSESRSTPGRNGRTEACVRSGETELNGRRLERRYGLPSAPRPESAADRDPKARARWHSACYEGRPWTALARELGVEIHHWKEWTSRGLSGIDASLREREGDLLEEERQAVRSKDGDSIINNEPYPCSKGVL